MATATFVDPAEAKESRVPRRPLPEIDAETRARYDGPAQPIAVGGACFNTKSGGVRLRYLPPNTRPNNKQKVFLSTTTDELFFGGSGGGGKSFALMAAALQFADVPGYSALILRRKLTDLTQAGALLDMSHEWLDPYKKFGVRFNANERRWYFPSGAKVQFGYLNHPQDVGRYRGGEFHFLGFDELGEFPFEDPYTFLFSRLRGPRGLSEDEVIRRFGKAPDGTTLLDIPLRVRSASNPGGPGMEWVKARFVDDETRKAFFIPSSYKDNPAIDNVEYEAALAKLSEVERRRMGDGDWEIAEVPGALWQMKMIGRDPWVMEDGVEQFDSVAMGVDPTVGSGAGDECGIVVVGVRADGQIVVLADCSMRGNPDEWSKVAVSAYYRYGCSRIACEDNQGGLMNVTQLTNAADKMGVAPPRVELRRAKGSKEQRAATVQSAYTRDPAKVVHSVELKSTRLEQQMVSWVPGGGRTQDSPDRVDALVWALREFLYLPERKEKPSNVVQQLSQW